MMTCRTGHPFVGPAGKLLDRALAEAGIERARLYHHPPFGGEAERAQAYAGLIADLRVAAEFAA